MTFYYFAKVRTITFLITAVKGNLVITVVLFAQIGPKGGDQGDRWGGQDAGWCGGAAGRAGEVEAGKAADRETPAQDGGGAPPATGAHTQSCQRTGLRMLIHRTIHLTVLVPLSLIISTPVYA